MNVLILTGPAGAGKNTIAKILADNISNTAVVDVDVVRHMLVNPHKAPWEGEEGKFQHTLGIENACLLAKNFLKNNFNIIILDVVSNKRVAQYRDFLKGFDPKIVLLLPTLDEIRKRNKMRTQFLKDEEIPRVYEEQVNFTAYDEKIDNTNLSPEDVAERLRKYLHA